MKKMISPASIAPDSIKRVKRILQTVPFLIAIFLMTGCDPSLVYEKNKDLGDAGWPMSELMKYNVEINDTTQPYNFYMNVRISDAYEYSNMFLYLKTLLPDGKISTDTIECFLADLDGRWLGKQSGNLIDNRIMLRYGFKFQQSGTYSFEFEQAMRDTVLVGVEDFGIRIEKTEK